MSQEFYDGLIQSITSLDVAGASDVSTRALEAGVAPLDLITYGIRAALDIMGENFSKGECFLPELMLSGRAADAAVSIIEPALLASGACDEKLGKIVIASVKDDLHDIGKNIVALMLRSAGFDVIDLGIDKSNEEILAAAEEHGADIIGLSTLMTTTMEHIPAFVDLLNEKGIRGNYKIMVGGAPLNAEYADKTGCDCYASDASESVSLAKELMGIPTAAAA